MTDEGGVIEDARLRCLTEHLVEGGLVDVEVVATETGGAEGGTLRLADGRQLGLVADEQQAAVAAVVDELEKIA